MALPPKFAAHKLEPAQPAPATAAGIPAASHTIEVYLDYVCPFSAKMFKTLTGTVVPMIRANPGWAHSVSFIFRQHIQPWHPSSTLTHEAALAVLRLAPVKFWDYSALLFEKQTSFFDVNVVGETRNQTYRRLADLAADVGLKPDDVYELLVISDKPGPDGSLNTGNAVTQDVKTVTKMDRLVGIHVSPTIVFDGIVHDISSSWGAEQWSQWLTNNIV